MSDGIFLAPYPALQYNPFSPAPEHKVTFHTSDTAGTTNAANSSTTATTTATTTTTSVNVEDAATLELKAQKLKVRYKEREEQKSIAAEEVDYIKNGVNCILAFGILFTFLALAAAVIAFGTPEWRVYYIVDDNKLNKFVQLNPSLRIVDKNSSISTAQFFTSRSRGLFVTCYAQDSFFNVYSGDQKASSWLNGYNCIWELKYNLQNTPIVIEDNCGEDPSIKNGRAMANLNTNLMRTQWLAFAGSIICLALGFLFSIISCRECRVHGSMLAGILLLFAVIFLLVGMVLFHVYIYLDEENLRCPPFYGAMKKSIYSDVIKCTYVYFGFSFYMGWSSFGLAIVACGFVLAAACQRKEAQIRIDRAMHSLTQINKEERAEKKFEELEARKKRKDMEKQIKKETRSKTKNTGSGIFAVFTKMKRKIPRWNVSDSEVDYEVKNMKKNKGATLRRLKYEMEDEIELEKSKIKATKEKQFEELKRAQRDLEEVERRIKILERTKKQQEKKKPRVDYDSSSDDSEVDVKTPPSHKKKKVKRSRSVESFQSVGENWKTIDSKCGRVVKPVELRQQTCCDPYTLHLPTGFNPPPYRP